MAECWECRVKAMLIERPPDHEFRVSGLGSQSPEARPVTPITYSLVGKTYKTVGNWGHRKLTFLTIEHASRPQLPKPKALMLQDMNQTRYSLNSLKGGYISDYIGEYSRGD